MAIAVVPPPPRRTGDAETDVVMILEWANQLYRSTVVESGLLDPSFQANAGEFDPAALPEPGKTSIARAQLTANEAYRLAQRVAVALGEFTLDGANNQVTITFPAARESTDYAIVVQPVDFSGSPSVTAFATARIVKTQESVVITMAAAPGTGNSVRLAVLLLPTPQVQ